MKDITSINKGTLNQTVDINDDTDKPPDGTDNISYPRSDDPLWEFINNQWKDWFHQKGAPIPYLFEKPHGQGQMFPSLNAQPPTDWFSWSDIPFPTIFSIYVPIGTRLEIRHKYLTIRTHFVQGLYRDLRHDLKFWDNIAINIKGINEKVTLTSQTYSDLEFRFYRVHNYWHLLNRHCLRTPENPFLIGNRRIDIHMKAYCDATIKDFCSKEVHASDHPWKHNHSIRCDAVVAQDFTDRVHGKDKNQNCLNYDYMVDKDVSYVPTDHRLCSESPEHVAMYFKERMDNGTHKFTDEGGPSSFTVGMNTFVNTRSSGKASELAEYDNTLDNLREQSDMEWSDWETGLITCILVWFFILVVYFGVNKWGHFLSIPSLSVSPLFKARDYLDRNYKTK